MTDTVLQTQPYFFGCGHFVVIAWFADDTDERFTWTDNDGRVHDETDVLLKLRGRMGFVYGREIGDTAAENDVFQLDFGRWSGSWFHLVTCPRRAFRHAQYTDLADNLPVLQSFLRNREHVFSTSNPPASAYTAGDLVTLYRGRKRRIIGVFLGLSDTNPAAAKICVHVAGGMPAVLETCDRFHQIDFMRWIDVRDDTMAALETMNADIISTATGKWCPFSAIGMTPPSSSSS